MIKLICSDIDGTLLNKDRQLSINTISQVKKLAHIPFILISSRMPKAMFHLQQELNITNLPMIAYNGGLIVANGKVIDSTEIDIKITKHIALFCNNSKIHVSLYHHNEWFVPQMDFWAKREQNNTKVIPTVKPVSEIIFTWKKEDKGAHKIMCMGDEIKIDNLVKFINTNYNKVVITYRSKPTYLEISHKSISKKTAIKTLIKHIYPTIKPKNIMAFGDNYNDIKMLDFVGVGVAVENAVDKAMQVSNYITESNKNDGVALFLESYLG